MTRTFTTGGSSRSRNWSGTRRRGRRGRERSIGRWAIAQYWSKTRMAILETHRFGPVPRKSSLWSLTCRHWNEKRRNEINLRITMGQAPVQNLECTTSSKLKLATPFTKKAQRAKLGSNRTERFKVAFSSINSVLTHRASRTPTFRQSITLHRVLASLASSPELPLSLPLRNLLADAWKQRAKTST